MRNSKVLILSARAALASIICVMWVVSPALAEMVQFETSPWHCDLSNFTLHKFSTKQGVLQPRDFSSALKPLKLKISKLKGSPELTPTIKKKIAALIAQKKFINNCKNKSLTGSAPGATPTPTGSPTPSPSPAPSATPSPTPVPTPSAPLSAAVMSGDRELTISWSDVPEASSYNLYWSTVSGSGTSGTKLSSVSNPHVHVGLTNTTTYYYVITAQNEFGEGLPSVETSGTPQAAGSTAYDPPWAGAIPSSIIAFNYNSAQTSAQNGAALKSAILALTAGQMIEIDGGLYDLPTNNFNLNPQGTEQNPIWIVAKQSETPIIRMPTTSKNIVDMCNGANGAQYTVIRGIEFTGGSAGIRFHNCSNIWFDQNQVHHTGDAAITTNTYDTSRMYITRNEIHHTGGYGEGMYLGANNGTVKMSASVIALNHVYSTTGTTQGDGIELKQGSYNNWIVENTVHDTNYPCILVYGTGGEAVNTVERNIAYRSNDNTMQVQGEAIVRNNLVMAGAANAFFSSNHQGQSVNLRVAHNTFINTGRAVYLSSWASKANMLFVNNVAYSLNSNSILCSGACAGVTVAGNVVYGTVSGVAAGYVTGAGLSDFVNLSWDGTVLDAHPTAGSAIIGAANAAYLEPEDLAGFTRTAPFESGCYEGLP